MKHKFAAAALALSLALSCAAGCSDTKKSTPKNGGTAVSGSGGSAQGNQGSVSDSMELMRQKYADVPDIDGGPFIKISDTTVSAGEIAEVTVSVRGAQQKWNMCGIHITYPDVLECQLRNEEDLVPKYKVGDACELNMGFEARDWRRNLHDELIKKHLRSVFFATIFKENDGLDGDIATFYFKVPDNAQPGAVYKLGYYYMESDMFRNFENDMSFEKFAFEHLTEGSITVK